jgi:hypothetical protein
LRNDLLYRVRITVEKEDYSTKDGQHRSMFARPESPLRESPFLCGANNINGFATVAAARSLFRHA